MWVLVFWIHTHYLFANICWVFILENDRCVALFYHCSWGIVQDYSKAPWYELCVLRPDLVKWGKVRKNVIWKSSSLCGMTSDESRFNLNISVCIPELTLTQYNYKCNTWDKHTWMNVYMDQSINQSINQSKITASSPFQNHVCGTPLCWGHPTLVHHCFQADCHTIVLTDSLSVLSCPNALWNDSQSCYACIYQILLYVQKQICFQNSVWDIWPVSQYMWQLAYLCKTDSFSKRNSGISLVCASVLLCMSHFYWTVKVKNSTYKVTDLNSRCLMHVPCMKYWQPGKLMECKFVHFSHPRILPFKRKMNSDEWCE